MCHRGSSMAVSHGLRAWFCREKERRAPFLNPLGVHAHLSGCRFFTCLLCTFNSLQLEGDIVWLFLRHRSPSRKFILSDRCTSVVMEQNCRWRDPTCPIWPLFRPSLYLSPSLYQTSRSWHLFRNVPDKNGYSYLNVLARFGKTSQTAVAKNNWRLWIGFF